MADFVIAQSRSLSLSLRNTVFETRSNLESSRARIIWWNLLSRGSAATGNKDFNNAARAFVLTKLSRLSAQGIAGIYYKARPASICISNLLSGAIGRFEINTAEWQWLVSPFSRFTVFPPLSHEIRTRPNERAILLSFIVRRTAARPV